MIRTLRNFFCLALLGLLIAPPLRSSQAGSARGERGKEADKSFQEADAALNKTYQQLLDKLDEASQKRVREAQRAWVAFRDTDADSHANLLGRNVQGSDLLDAEARVDLTNARLHELEQMLKEIDPK